MVCRLSVFLVAVCVSVAHGGATPSPSPAAYPNLVFGEIAASAIVAGPTATYPVAFPVTVSGETGALSGATLIVEAAVTTNSLVVDAESVLVLAGGAVTVNGNANIQGSFVVVASGEEPATVHIAAGGTVNLNNAPLSLIIDPQFNFGPGVSVTVLSYPAGALTGSFANNIYVSNAPTTTASATPAASPAAAARGFNYRSAGAGVSATVTCGSTTCVATGVVSPSPTQTPNFQFAFSNNQTPNPNIYAYNVGIGIGIGLGVPIVCGIFLAGLYLLLRGGSSQPRKAAAPAPQPQSAAAAPSAGTGAAATGAAATGTAAESYTDDYSGDYSSYGADDGADDDVSGDY